MEVLIAGGGIGGLTTAMFLHDRGISVRVYEAVPEIRELGVGINMLPHAVRGLSKLGLQDAVVAAGLPTQELRYFNMFGQEIWSEPRGTYAGYKWPQVSIHRGRLHKVLYDAARERLGDDRILTDHRLTGFEDTGDKVIASFTDHSGTQTRPDVTGDILIAVDGIHSRARQIFYPDEGDPNYSGVFMWRAVTKAKPYFTGATMILAGHDNQWIVSYPITEPDENGEALVNWAALMRGREMLRREDWSRTGSLEDFAPHFDNWRFDWLDVPALIRGAEEVFEYPMVDRDPIPKWTHGRVTLLGDAAHPMYPIGSNGASQAILDANVLADNLVEYDDPVEALHTYEATRLAATTNVIKSNRDRGPEVVMQMAHERAPDGFTEIEEVIPRRELEEISARYRKLAGFDRDQLD